MGIRGLRTWCAERGRAHFALTLAMLVGLTGAGGALLVLPNIALPKITAAQPDTALGPAAPDDQRLLAVQRTMTPFGEITADRYETASNRDGLVIAHRAQHAESQVLGAELAPATTAIADLLGEPWSAPTAVVLASNPSEFAALVRSPSILPGQVAAVTVTDPATPGAPPASRVVFSPEAATRLTPEELRTLLRHELTHVATRPTTADGAPPWMTEGFAEYAAHRATPHNFARIAPTLTTALTRGDLPKDLPTPQDLAGPKAAAAYESAWTACAYIAEKYGEQALVTLYHRLTATPQDTAGEDRILRETLNTSRPNLITQWSTWLPTKAP